MNEIRETADIETSSAEYAGRFSGPAGAWMLEVQAGIVREMVGAPEGSRQLLDVGGGHNQVAAILETMGWEVTVQGSDQVCEERLPETLRKRFVVADPLGLPFADRSFERVVCLRLLTHCHRWQELVAELCRVSRRGVVVDFPVCRGLNRWAPVLFGFKKKMEGNTRHWRQFSEPEVFTSFKRHAFRCEQVQAQFFWPMVLHRKLRRPAVSRALEAMPRRLRLTQHLGSPLIAHMAPTGYAPR